MGVMGDFSGWEMLVMQPMEGSAPKRWKVVQRLPVGKAGNLEFVVRIPRLHLCMSCVRAFPIS
jgi:hypothetical protein